MTIRPKTKRRILFLIFTAGVICILGFWGYRYRMQVADQKIQQAKIDGMAAYAAGDFPTALDRLAIYINRTQKQNPDQLDADALYAFAMARSKVPTSDDSYIPAAINTLRRYCTIAPSNLQAKEQLLEMETPFPGFAPSATLLAADILKDHPDDLTALKAQAELSFRNQKFQDAADAADKFARINPTDLEMQHLVMAVMKARGIPGKLMHQRADALSAQFPNDPRFILVKAWAYQLAQADSENADQRQQENTLADKLVIDASKLDPPDTQFVRITLMMLDSIHEFSSSRNLLANAVAKFNDPILRQQLAVRMWESRNYVQLIDLLKDLDSASPQASPTMIAYKALSLFATDQKPAAARLFSQLAPRNDDRSAKAWSIGLDTFFKGDSLDVNTRVTQYRAALTSQPENGFLNFELGDALAREGEFEQAMQYWRRAAKAMPSWAEPNLRIATLLTERGHGNSEEAMRAAEQAIQASTSVDGKVDLHAIIAHIEVRFATLPYNPNPAFLSSLQDEVKQVQTQLPNEPNTLPIYVSLLAGSNQRAQAIDAINNACQNPGEADPDLLIRLAQVSRTAKLGMDSKIYQAMQRKYGATPQAASDQAMTLLQDGHADQGLQLLLSSKSQATGDALPWDRVICQYREVAHDPGAAAAWKQLGDAYPNDIGVQSVILTGEDQAWQDRAFIERTMDRFKALTGDDSGIWKMARARWLLSSDNPQRDASEAIVLLHDLIAAGPDEYRPHVLLAMAYDRLGSSSVALEEWRKSAEVAPTLPQAQFEFLQALHKNGKFDEAQSVFDKLAGMPHLNADLALSAATLMAAEGDLQRAESLLLAYPHPTAQLLHDATLAKVYRLENRPKDASGIYLQLAKLKLVDANTIREAADFFGNQGDLPEARNFLDRLNDLQLQPGQRELLLAEFEEHHGTAQNAAKDYADAVKVTGEDPSAAIRQIGYFLRQHDWEQAQNALSTGLAHWPNNQSFNSLKTSGPLLTKLPQGDEYDLLIAAIANDPQNPAANETLLTAANTSVDAAASLDALQKLLPKYPNFEPLYLITARRLIALGRSSDAAALSNKAIGQFPQSPDAARVIAEAKAADGNWNAAIMAAKTWRLRIIENPLPADLFIASADLNADDAGDAVDRLTPYIADAKTHSDDNQNLLILYAEALIRNGNQSDAVSLLQPLAQKSSAWRKAWLNAAPIAFKDGNQGAAWIELIRPMLDPKSIEEQTALARAYFDLATTRDYAEGAAKAESAIAPFLSSATITPAQYMIYANAATTAGDDDAADTAYRHILQMDPNNGIAQNNLADLLRTRNNPNSLTEAEQFATRAISTHPSDPNLSTFYDTLAHIYLKQEKPADAIAAFEKGFAAEPRNLDILIGLASACATNHRVNDAVRYLAQIDRVLPPGTKIASDLQAELQSARDAVRKASPRGSLSGTDFSPGGN